MLNINKNSWLYFPSELPERGDYNFSWHKFQEFQLFSLYSRSYNSPSMTWVSGRTKLLVTSTAQSKFWIFLSPGEKKIFALPHTLPGFLKLPLWALLLCGSSLFAVLFVSSPDQAFCALVNTLTFRDIGHRVLTYGFWGNTVQPKTHDQKFFAASSEPRGLCGSFSDRIWQNWCCSSL